MASFFASLRVNMATTRADFYPPLLFSLLQSWKKNNSFPKKIPKFPQNFAAVYAAPLRFFIFVISHIRLLNVSTVRAVCRASA
jgi:hypothetical protein